MLKSSNYKNKYCFWKRFGTEILSILNSFCIDVFSKRSFIAYGMERGEEVATKFCY